MPTYDFTCKKCEKTFEIMSVPFDRRDDPRKCECGGDLKRVEVFSVNLRGFNKYGSSS